MKSTDLNDNKYSIIDGVIWKEILRFFFPILLGSVLQQVYNIVDTIIVGKFISKEALSAVGGSDFAILGLFIFFFVGISSGATVVVARNFGAKNEKKVNNSIHSAVALGVTIGPAICIIGIITAKTALVWLNTSEELMEPAIVYLKIIFVGMMPGCIYNMASGILRGIGDSKRPFYFLLISTVLNIVLDVVFVVVFHWGVAGAAWATSIAQLVSAVLAVRALLKYEGTGRLNLREIKFYKEETREILAIGIPAALQSCMYSIANILIQSVVNTFSTAFIAGVAIEAKVDGIYFMISGAFGNTATTFVGQNYGAGYLDRARKSIKWCLLYALIGAIVIGGGLFAFARPISSCFTNEAEVVDASVLIFTIIMPTLVLTVPMDICSGAMRGLGHSVEPLIATLISVCLVRVGWVYLIVPIFNTATSLLIGWPVSWLLGGSALGICYLVLVKKIAKSEKALNE